VSAIGYLFARDLHERTGVPVGMMQAAWGDTLIKFWTPLAALQANPALASYVQEWETLSPQMGTLAEPQRVPAAIFNGMVAPQAPYGVRGVLWYQGESDGWTPDDYHSLFVALIQGWRAAWNREVPFLFVQLPNYTTVATEPPNVSLWSELREAQEQTLSLPETEMVVTIDIGGESIHPTNKPEVARRLMLAARAKVYGENVPYSGPRFQQAVVNGSQVNVSFTHVEGGLAVRDGGAIKGFALAGSNHQWYWADAVISGSGVVLSSAQVPNPVAVRYAWAFNPENNLINSVGLPCAPFRTDNW
jgi:sialate O-acetylesterase